MPRRHLALLLLGLLHVGMGLRMWLRPPVGGDPDLAIWHELMPVWLRIGLWAGLGVACVLASLWDRTERAGWILAVLMPVERTTSYAWSVLMWLIPGWPPGAVASLGAAVFWALLSALIVVMAGWPEQQEGRA